MCLGALLVCLAVVSFYRPHSNVGLRRRDYASFEKSGVSFALSLVLEAADALGCLHIKLFNPSTPKLIA